MSTVQNQPVIEYPESDGLPMADNTLQFRWIVTLQGGLDKLFRDDPNVFVAGDLFWYPIEGNNTTCMAPDTMVVFGRPKGDRRSYRQWDEGGIAPQVVFEVLSPSNRPGDMARKLLFYETYGVEEYYIYDPDHVRLEAYIRLADNGFAAVPETNGYVSPLLGIRFDLSGEEMVVYRPDGQRFLSYLEISDQADEESERAEKERQRAEKERERAEKERLQAEKERQRAEKERERAEKERQRAEKERQQAETATAELARLRERLRAAGIDPDAAG